MLITLWFRAISDTKRFPAGPAEGDRVASSTLHLGGRGHQRGEDTGRVPRVQGERCLECHDFTVFTIDVSATCLLDYLKWHCVRQKGEKLGYVMTHNGPITRQNLLCIAGNAHMHVFSHICQSIGRHFRCSVDMLIVTAWLKVSFQGNLRCIDNHPIQFLGWSANPRDQEFGVSPSPCHMLWLCYKIMISMAISPYLWIK